MSASKPSSLPGFLRRSIRTVNEEDENLDNSNDHGLGLSSPVGPRASKSLISDLSPASDGVNKIGGGINKLNLFSDDDDSNDGDSISTGDNIDRKFRMVKTSSHKVTNQDSNKIYGKSIDGAHAISKGASSASAMAMNFNNSNNNSAGSSGDEEIKDVRSTKDKRNDNINDNGVDKTTIRTSSSMSSTGTNKSSNSNTSNRGGGEKIKNYKEVEFDKVISSPVVDITDLRKLAWNGIPPEHRPQAWKILLGYLPTNASRRPQTLKRKRSEYRDAIAQHYDIDDHSRTMQEQETLRQVLVDVPRTAPDVPLFRNDLVRKSLTRLLYIWAMRHPASSYVQGINDLATPLIAVFMSEYFKGDVLQGEELEDLTPEILKNVEADVYWCLTNLLAGIQDHYTQDQPGVQRMVMRLEELVTRIDAGLTGHLQDTGVLFMQFAFRWMNCLLLREFNLTCIIRLWDTYLSEGDGGFETFHVYVCAAFLCQFSEILQGMPFDELFAFMQNIPTNDWDDDNVSIVLSQAFVLSTLFQGSDAHLTSSSPRIN